MWTTGDGAAFPSRPEWENDRQEATAAQPECGRVVTGAGLARFAAALRAEERAPGTQTQYLRQVKAYADFAGDREASRELTAQWREALLGQGRASTTVNAALAALHHFFTVMGWEGCRARYLKTQRRLFRDGRRELGEEEYRRLVHTANARKQQRLALLLECLGTTGIRVSELRYITVEALRQRRAVIRAKGKLRTILVPGKLAKKLLAYARQTKIRSGEVFRTRSGRSLGRRQIWAEMKALARQAGVAAGKVFPHNLRHLFARAYYRQSRDMARLADVLGHSSLETTRIYLMSTEKEQARLLSRLGLLV